MNDGGREKINVFGVLLDRVDYYKACQMVEKFLQSYGRKVIVTPNAEIIMAARKSKDLMEMLNKADICLPDGIGVVIASRILGKPLLERTTGFDLMIKVIKMAQKQGLSLFLLGGKPGVAQKAAVQLKLMFPGVNICGTHHGYFKEEEEHKIIDIINDNKTDILLVAMGFPKQEKFMIESKDKLEFRIAMGVGGSFDVLSGNVSRAPVFMQKAGLEWLFRLITQPWRFKRMKVLPLFLIEVVIHRLFSGKTKSKR
ncbi:MAG: WecB/TagA/CpsF family glycosyltransferase [Thermoanaerobacteraceae bacterium]|nr:WecB/TagA/CpsF family glycosyltransferase [Thermoanaerobacteraceae bacterium]